MEKYLPIGSVVLLKEANKRIMIVGFCPEVNIDNNKQSYDYSGCYFPEGILNSEDSLLFNHDQIDRVFYYGLIDDEQKDFMERLKKLIEEEIEIPIMQQANNIVSDTEIETL